MVYSAAVLVIVNVAFWLRKAPLWIAGGCVAFFILGPIFFGPARGDENVYLEFFFLGRKVLVLQTIFLVFLVRDGLSRRWKWHRFCGLSLLGTSFVCVLFTVPWFVVPWSPIYETAVLSTMGLAVVSIALWRQNRFWYFASCAAFGLVGAGVGFLQAIFLAALLGAWRRWQLRWFLPVSVLGTAAIFAIFLVPWLPRLRELEELRAELPFESLEEKLPLPKPGLRRTDLSAEALQILDQYEGELKRQDTIEGRRLDREARGIKPTDRDSKLLPSDRASTLAILHKKQLLNFINSDGFGRRRMVGGYYKENLTMDPLPELPQQGAAIPLVLSAGELREAPEKTPVDSLRSMHVASYGDFVNYLGFGYVKDRKHVAGFQSHGFRAPVQKKEGWKVERVELVGLLLHDHPVVYLTEGLPRMDKARRSPTRALDVFEAAGLEELQHGQELFLRQGSGGLRLLGAVRAIEQCVKCHDCERGDLLGAFSYYLVKE